MQLSITVTEQLTAHFKVIYKTHPQTEKKRHIFCEADRGNKKKMETKIKRRLRKEIFTPKTNKQTQHINASLRRRGSQLSLISSARKENRININFKKKINKKNEL